MGAGASPLPQQNRSLTRTKEVIDAVEEPLIQSLHSRFADERTEALETTLTLSTTSPALFFDGDQKFPLVHAMGNFASIDRRDQLYLAMASLIANLAAAPTLADSPAPARWIAECIPGVLEPALESEYQHLRREAVRAFLSILKNYPNLRQVILGSAHIMQRIELESGHQAGRCPDAVLESHARECLMVSGVGAS